MGPCRSGTHDGGTVVARRTSFGATNCSTSDRGRSRPATRTFFGIVATGAVLAACGSSPGSSPAPTTTPAVYGQGDLRSIYCTGQGTARECGGLVTPVPGVTDRIILNRTSVPTGTTIHGSVEVDNHTGSVINLLDPHGCQPSMAVSVTSVTVAPGGGFSAVCTSRPLALAVGTTRIPVDIITSYSGCGPAGSTDSTLRPSFPECLPHGRVPNLPVGTYHAVLIGLGLALPPASSAVTLTRAR